MVKPITDAQGAQNRIPPSLGNAKNLYNTTNADKANFMEAAKERFKIDNTEAEALYNTMASMEKDGTQGLTNEEYKSGLTEKRELIEIKRDKIMGQFVPEAKRKDFAKMSQTEKLDFIKSQIPHDSENDVEAQIMAELVLTNLNQYNAEIEYLEMELEIEKNYEEEVEQLNKSQKDQNKQQFKGIG